MGEHANATYTVTSWEEDTVLELDDGSKMTRTRVTGTYEGDLEGKGSSESVMWYLRDGTATYVGLERIRGRIGDRSGTFVIRSSGTYDGREARSSLEVAPGSGTAELEGLAGRGTLVAPTGPQGAVELEYELP